MRDTRKNILTLFKSINHSTIAMLVLAFSFTACVQPEYDPLAGLLNSNATIESEIVSSNATTVSGTTFGNNSLLWVLQVLQGSDFCTIPTPTGSVGSAFSIRLNTNASGEERLAKVRITFTDGYTKEFSIRQLAETENMEYDHPWAEQPGYREGASLIHKTYYTTLSDNRRVRNFSICYDTDKMCSRWVAYPAHSIYTNGRNYEVGGTTAGRTNAWAFDDAVTQYKYSSNWSNAYEIVSKYDASLDTYDTHTNPIIPQSRQANIVGSNGFGSGWARGHMLPSADRYNTWNTNAQTCYATNIMVQQYDFNGDSWGNLENKVRTRICSDTLYVVVGTLFENNKTVNRYNRVVSVPSHCFKLLLRTKNGNTKKHIANIKSADELMCIGFIFENSATGASTSLSSAAVSVAELERRSGFTFFRNLDPSIADEVKSQKDFSAWGF